MNRHEIVSKLVKVAAEVPFIEQRRKLLQAARQLTAEAAWEVIARKLVDAIVDTNLSWYDAFVLLSKASDKLVQEDQDHEWYKWRSNWYVRSTSATSKSLYSEKVNEAREDLVTQLHDAESRLGRRAERALATIESLHLDELFEVGVDLLGWDEGDMDHFFERLGLDADDLKAGDRKALEALKAMNDGRLFRTSAKWYFAKAR